MNKRILVTGSRGFTGRYVCTELKRKGYEVFGLTSNYSVTGKSIDLNEKDALSSAISVLKPTSVIHLAAIAYVDHGSEADFLKVNVEGTSCLLNQLRKLSSSLDSVIVASSANVYGNSVIGSPIPEDAVPNPQNFYAESKLLMEEKIKSNFMDLPITIVRPFNYTGVGQSVNFLVPKIVSAFKLKKRKLELGNLDVSRDFSDVRFVAKVYGALLDNGIKNQVLNICSGKLYSLKHILQDCYQITGHQLEVRSVSSLQRQNEIVSLCGDPSKMIELSGCVPQQSFCETLRWMLTSRA